MDIHVVMSKVESISISPKKLSFFANRDRTSKISRNAVLTFPKEYDLEKAEIGSPFSRKIGELIVKDNVNRQILIIEAVIDSESRSFTEQAVEMVLKSSDDPLIGSGTKVWRCYMLLIRNENV